MLAEALYAISATVYYINRQATSVTWWISTNSQLTEKQTCKHLTKNQWKIKIQV